MFEGLQTAVRSWLGTWPMSEFPRVFGSGPTKTGVSVSEWSALNYSAVWAAVSTVSADVASLPLVLYKRTPNGGKTRYTDSKLYELLHDAPNPEMGSMVFREALQAHAMTWGNGYAEIQRDDLKRPIALWPITPDRVTPFRDETNRQLRYRVTNTGGGQTVIRPENMLHVPGLGFDGVQGYSVVEKARESISLGLATEAFGETFFGNGSTFGGVLTHPGKLTKEVKQGIRESIESVHAGVDRAHKFFIMGDGMTFTKTGIPPNDAQFLETRKFQIAEISRWFGGVPLHKLGDLERATFSNIEQQDIEYYKGCLRRWLVRWEQEINRKLISSLERRQQFVKHNVEGILRGDSAARSTFYREMFNIGAYSINMILESEDLNQIGPEGDVHFVQGNLMPAELAMEGPPDPLPVVTVKKPDELPPADDDEDDDRALHMLEDIALKTVAIEATLMDQRHALTADVLAAHQATVARLEAERSDLQLQFDASLEQHANDATTLHAQVEEARAEAAVAQEALGTAQAAVVPAQEAQRQAERDAAQHVAEASAALIAQRQAEVERMTGMLTAHRALLVQVVGRIVRRETDRARRHQATPEKLRTWMESFYVTYEDECVDELKPAVRAHLAWRQSAEDVDAATVALVRAHLEESQRQLRAIVTGEPDEMHAHLERMLQRWEQDRPNALADQVLLEEVEHVRSYR